MIAVRCQHVVPYYVPAKVLVRLGLAEWKDDRLHITKAGWSHLPSIRK